MMTLNEYADWTHGMWVSFPSEAQQSDDKSLFIATFGLAGESGEVAALVHERHMDGVWVHQKWTAELGDVTFYACFLMKMFGLKPLDIITPRLGNDVVYAHAGTIGYMEAQARLAAQVGIVVEKVKKYLRDGTDVPLDVVLPAFRKIWTAVEDLSFSVGVPINDVFMGNVAKIEGRKARGTRRGSGDNR